MYIIIPTGDTMGFEVDNYTDSTNFPIVLNDYSNASSGGGIQFLSQNNGVSIWSPEGYISLTGKTLMIEGTDGTSNATLIFINSSGSITIGSDNSWPGSTNLIGKDISIGAFDAYGYSNIGFFGSPPVQPQVSGGTLAGVIAGLVALGLFSS